eukprot:scaffold25619_cov137-Cylindrotheca_fusiformis.AAC.2
MDQEGQTKESQEQMDLSGWNSDLDSSLLSGWSENNETDTRSNSEFMPKDRMDNEKSSSISRSPPRADNWEGNLNQWSQLPSFAMDYESNPSDKTRSTESAKSTSASSAAQPSAEMVSLSSRSRDGGVSVAETSDRTSSQESSSQAPANSNVQQLHPQGIQSSATCPPHGNSSNQMLPPNYFPHPAQHSNLGQNMFGLNFSQPMTNANAVSLATSLQQPQNQRAPSSSSYNQSQNLSSLAANFMLAHNNPDAAAGAPHQAQADAVQQQQQQHVQNTNSANRISPNPSSSGVSSLSANSGSNPSSTSRRSRRPTQPPPFYLFDAPIELRANFIQNQRRLGLPVQNDCNSYHYGEAVKGFHPQDLNEGGNNGSSQLQKNRVKLISARHGSRPNTGRAKNEREQRRAQKITDLIDQLRSNMEEGGWKLELKSKYHTLSSCAEYVKHMIKKTKEKEEAVGKLKAELSVKQEKMEDDKAVQESRSDPESVTSSLTTSTTGSARVHSKAELNKKRKAENGSNQKTGSQSSHLTSIVSTNEDSSGGPSNQSYSIGKTVSSVSEITDSNRGSSSNNSGGSGSQGGSTEQEQPSRVSYDETNAVREQSASSGSISSDVAVASRNSIHDQHNGNQTHNHKDVVFTKGKWADRKRPAADITSGERSFNLDYEEIFDNSNVPQVIAGTSGKIVSWNKCFLKATGLSTSEVERMTVFSLVKPDKLSNSFEIVAEALKNNDESSTTSTSKKNEVASDDKTEIATPSDKSQQETVSSERQLNFAAMTLPCIDFPAMALHSRGIKDAPSDSGSLFVTVCIQTFYYALLNHNVELTSLDSILYPFSSQITLMTDDDPQKRCFHCTFTNCPGTNGSLGMITPDLLTALFRNSGHSKTRKHHGRRRKRARTQNNDASKMQESRDCQQALEHCGSVATDPV